MNIGRDAGFKCFTFEIVGLGRAFEDVHIPILIDLSLTVLYAVCIYKDKKKDGYHIPQHFFEFYQIDIK